MGEIQGVVAGVAAFVQEGSGGEYLEAQLTTFMILTAQVRAEKLGVIPSVTHVDGSARPQTVEKEINRSAGG